MLTPFDINGYITNVGLIKVATYSAWRMTYTEAPW